MPGFREVQYYLAGLWLLIRLDPRGFRYLDMSERGVNRSFWAMAWCLPPMGISWLWWRQAFLRSMPGLGKVEIIRPGDRVFFEPDEDHWHGAAPNRFMAHLALNEVDDDHPLAVWGDKVTDEEYAAGASDLTA